MLRVIVPVILLLLALAPSDGAVTPLARPWIEVTINGNPGVLLPREAAYQLVSGDDVEGYWLPGEEWLAEAENAVVKATSEIPDEERRPRIEGYRQFAGFMLDGQRMIAINSFCDEFEGWRQSVVYVADGGACYWQATYNATTGELTRLMVNGHAWSRPAIAVISRLDWPASPAH